MAPESSSGPAKTPPLAAPKPRTCLIIGANRGIGLQLAKRFIDRGYVVFGTHRPETRDDISVQEMLSCGVKTLELDFTDERTVSLAALNFGDRPLDLLVNCAGVYHLWDDKTFLELSADDILTHFRVNVLGPFMVSKAFHRALATAPSAKVINVSSDMASISDNTGGNACYRISKTALNQLTKTMAVDLERTSANIKTLAVHPGFVATKLTGYYGEDDMQSCMDALAATIERFGTEGDDIANGSYVKWTGEPMSY